MGIVVASFTGAWIEIYDETLEVYGVITDLVCNKLIKLLGLKNNDKNFSFICMKVQEMNGNFKNIID